MSLAVLVEREPGGLLGVGFELWSRLGAYYSLSACEAEGDWLGLPFPWNGGAAGVSILALKLSAHCRLASLRLAGAELERGD
eukprot:gene20204-26949_t